MYFAAEWQDESETPRDELDGNGKMMEIGPPPLLSLFFSFLCVSIFFMGFFIFSNFLTTNKSLCFFVCCNNAGVKKQRVDR